MNKNQAIENAKNEIQAIEETMLLCRQLPSCEAYNISITRSTIHVTMPYNLKTLRQYRRAMGQGWTQSTCSTTNHEGGFISQCFSYYKQGYKSSVLLAMQTDLSGSVCQVKKVGERMQPIYEVICL